jgi:hypothetical protein
MPLVRPDTAAAAAAGSTDMYLYLQEVIHICSIHKHMLML